MSRLRGLVNAISNSHSLGMELQHEFAKDLRVREKENAQALKAGVLLGFFIGFLISVLIYNTI